MSALKLLSSNKCHGGTIRKYSHASTSTLTDMRLNVFFPSSATQTHKVPALYFLSGLTCTEDNFMQKSCVQRKAEELQIAIVAPDTSPRGANLPGEKDSWDFGDAASFYVNATKQPFNQHYQMYTYITEELPALIESQLPISSVKSIFGHSMGGHGALQIFLKNPQMYRSVSAFAPIAHPSACPWGEKAFNGYLNQRSEWAQYDATDLVKNVQLEREVEILIDQGLADEFYRKKQLLPEDFVEAAKLNSNVKVKLRMQADYDHSYYFIQSFIDDHLEHHAEALKQ